MTDGEPGPDDDTQRTYLAQERTLLAWWRSGLACFAVALAFGRLVPALLQVSAGPFVVIGLGFGLLGLAFVYLGTRRDRLVTRYLAEGHFPPISGGEVWGLAAALLVLGVATMILLIIVSW
jgi:putative membrane protein